MHCESAVLRAFSALFGIFEETSTSGGFVQNTLPRNSMSESVKGSAFFGNTMPSISRVFRPEVLLAC